MKLGTAFLTEEEAIFDLSHFVTSSLARFVLEWVSVINDLEGEQQNAGSNHCHQAGEETIAKMKYQLWKTLALLSSKDQPEASTTRSTGNPKRC